MNEREIQEQLKREIAQSENRMANCKHDFATPIYDAEEVMVQDDRTGYETHGVDRWPVPSFHKEKKDRWSRECKECGKIEYTYKQEPVIKNYEPKF